MALIGTLRNKMGKIVVGAIMVTMVAFIGTDLIGNSTLLGGGDNPEIGEIAGNSITNAAFQRKVDELSSVFALNARRSPLQEETEEIRAQAWNALLFENIYQEQFDELGIVVSPQEQKELVSGSNIHPFFVQNFTNPQTGVFDPEIINQQLVYLKTEASEQERLMWIETENMVFRARKVEKYTNLFTKTNYVTTYEAQDQYKAQNATATIDYMYVPFLSVSDSSVSVSESELEAYLENNASEFKREESRSMEYVVFDIVASAADSAIVQDEIATLQNELTIASNDSSFVSINSDDPYSFITYTEDNLPISLQDQEVGYVSEPAISNGAYEFYKLSRMDEPAPDSLLYRVAKIRKEFFVSDETINEVYRKADYFAASVGNVEEFRNQAAEQGLSVQSADDIGKNAEQVGRMREARTLVLWLYNDATKGAVSEVKEVGSTYVVAAMTDEQEEGTANLAEVRNQVEQKVRNEKKAETLIAKINGLDGADLESKAAGYGDGAKTGSADVQLFSNSITGVGYAPEAVGLAFALEEEEVTGAFEIQNGVLAIKLNAVEMPEDQEDYSVIAQQVSRQRLGQNTIIGDFPMTYFRLLVPKSIDSAVKEFAEIEDQRYKFF